MTEACETVTGNPRLNAVTRISQARLLATAIHLREDITSKQRQQLLSRWEKVSFRIYGLLKKDARTRVGDYVRLAWRVIKEQLSVDAIDEAIGEIGEEFPIEDAVDFLRNENCYDGWEAELRYFMFRYEEHLAREQKLNFSNEQWEKIWMVSPSESIEHIWAKSQAPDKSRHRLALLHGPEQIADLPVPVAESPGAVRIGHPERSHLVEYLAPNSVFNSLPRQRSSPHLRPDDRLVTIDRVLHHASLGVA